MNNPLTVLSLRGLRPFQPLRQFKRTRIISVLAACVVCALLATVFVWRQVYAAGILWSSAGGSAWLTGSNWTGGSVPSGTDIAQFGANPTAATGAGINFANTTNAGTQVNGQRIEEVGAVEITSARAAAMILGNSSGTSGATGTFRPTGATVNGVADVVIRNNSSQLLTIQNTQGAGNQTMSVALIDATNSIINIDGSGGITISSVISGSGMNLTRAGGGAGILTLIGLNTFSGGFTASTGTTNLSANSALGSVTSVSVASGATLQTFVLSLTNAINDSATVTLNGTMDITGGTETVASLAGTNTGAALKIGLNGGTTGSFTVGDTTSTSFSGVISGSRVTAGSTILTKQGTGTLTLSGTNTYSDATNISAGGLTITNNSGLGATGANNGTTVASGAVLALDGSGGNLTVGAEPLSLSGTGLAATPAGALRNITGSNSCSGAVTLAAASTITSSAGTLTLTGGIANGGSLGTFDGAGNTTVSTTKITGAGGLTKNGAGTLTVSAANDYTGVTTITAGTLSCGAANTLPSTSAISLNGGTLKTGATTGNTQSTGTLALTDNSTISLGTGSHTLTFSASNAVPWTAGKTLTITGWTGGYNGTSGTGGKIFVGSTSSGLTSGQLSQIIFFDGTSNYPATILSTGELVPTAATYYSKSSGNLDLLSTWGTATDGTGSSPTTFTSANQTFNIRNNPSPTIGAAWTVSGSGSKVILGVSTATAINFTVPSSFSFSGTIDIAAASSGSNTLTLQNSTIPTFGILDSSSTVNYDSSGSQTISAANYGNLTSTNSGGRSLASSGTIGIKGSFSPGSQSYTVTGSTVDFNGSGSSQTGPSVVFSYNNLTVSNSSGLTFAASQTVNGTLDLSAGDITTTSSFTLFQGGSSSTGAFDVVGNVNRGDVAAGSTKSFGNVNVQITQGTGTTGNDITVTLAKSAPNDFTNAVTRTYDITKNIGTLVPVGSSVRLRYKVSPDELNGNMESSLELWRRDGSTYTALGGTVDLTNHHVTYSFLVTDHFSRWVISDADAPTDVAMMNFKATRFDKQVHLEWQTGYEVSNVGFNVYREKNGSLERITPELIAGSALIAGPRVEMKAGLAYSWWDEEEIADCGSRNADCEGRKYWLEDIDLSGRTTSHGPFGVSDAAPGDQQSSPRDQQLLRKHNSSLLSAIGRDASLAQTAEAATVPVEPTAKVAKLTPARMTIQSGVASQTAVKLSVQRQGWYRVEQSELLTAGIPSGADPTMLQLFADGREVPMLVTNAAGSSNKTSGGSVIAGGGVVGGGGAGGGGGVKTSAWDGIEFYGIGIDSPSTINHVYWLVVGSQPGLRIGGSEAKGGSAAPSSFAYSVERRDKNLYFPALKNGGGEKWFGPLIYNAQPVDQSVTLQHVAPSGGGAGALMSVSLQGFTNTAHTVRVLFNGVEVGTMHFTGLQKASNKFTIPAANVHEGVNQIQLIGPAGTSDLSMVESVQVNYFHTNTADNNSLRMPVTGQQQVTIDGFTGSTIRVMDVTDANSPVELQTIISSTASKTSAVYSVTVTAPSSGARTVLAFAADQRKTPAQIAANQPSNYRDPGQHADYLIITRKDLIGSFDPLIVLRKSQNLAPAVIDIEDVYDEFSFGNKTPQALKDFLTYAKTTWAGAPRFVVLAGDATYDPKNYLALGDFDLVPTRFVETAFNEAATDDWFADVNGDSVPDIAIGRLPVRTPAEAAAMVTKLVSYDSSAASNNVLLVADRNSSYDFEAADTQLRALIPASLTVTDIRRGQLGDADARTQLLAALNQGAKVVNYYGHGSTTVWTDAPILSASDAAGLTNQNHLSLVVSMTCLNGYFYTPTIESLGESLLKAQGGAIAVWASSGLTDPTAQTVMSRDAISRLLGGTNLTIGEVVALAKGTITNLDVRRTWILLGDPATRLRNETTSKPK